MQKRRNSSALAIELRLFCINVHKINPCNKIQRYLFVISERFNLTTTGGLHPEFGSGVWLGATDEAMEGNFIWLPAGNPMVFNDWDYNQPNDYRVQDCTVYFHGPKKWNDVQCSDFMQMLICEGWCHTVK